MATQWKPLPFPFVTPGEVFSIGLVFPLVCIGLLGLRVHVRQLQKQKLGIDDWLAVLATVMLTGMGICFMVGERIGIMGYPTPVPSGTIASQAYGLFNKAYETEAKLEFAIQFLQCFQLCFVKSSIVFFIRRIFVSCRGSIMDWASMVLIIVIILWSVGFLMALIFGCGRNVALHWAPLQVLVASGCNGITPEKANLISDPILDVIILVFPLPSIWKLNMSTSKKWAVTGIFLIGIMSVAAAFTRLAFHIVVLNQGYGAGYDLNQTVTTIFYWSMMEAGLGTMAASLPTLSFILRKDSGLGSKLSNWSNRLRLYSWKSSGVQISGEDVSNGNSQTQELRAKRSDPDVSMDESTRSKELMNQVRIQQSLV